MTLNKLCTYACALANQVIHLLGTIHLYRQFVGDNKICGDGSVGYMLLSSTALIINSTFEPVLHFYPSSYIVKVPLMWNKPLTVLNKLPRYYYYHYSYYYYYY